MNWRLGLFRSWVVLSTVWIAYRTTRATFALCYFIPGVSFGGCMARDPFHGHPGPNLEDYAVWAVVTFSPPVLVLALALASIWAAAGFKTPTKSV